MGPTDALLMYALTEGGSAYREAKLAKTASFDPSQGEFKWIVIDGVTTRVRGEDYTKVIGAALIEGIEKKLKQPSGYVRNSDLNQLTRSTVSIPASFAGLEAEMVPTRLEDQLFRIYEVVENEDYVEVTARHVWYDNLKNFTVWEPTKDVDYTAASACRNILTNAISPVASRVASDCTDTKKGDQLDYKNKNLVECFLDPENGICTQFGLSLLRYNWDFYCLKNVGYNRGFVVENGKNLLGVERTESIENVATRVAAFGKDSSGNIVWLDYQNKRYVDSEHIDDYSHPMTELLDTGLTIGKDGVTAQNIQQKMLEAARKRFTEDHIDLPEVEMTIEFLSLGDTEEYAQYRGLDKVYLYDIITVKDTVRGYNYTAQVIGVEHDILTGMLNSVTIGKLDNWDGTRKIATWQVPEINGENIRLKSILAGVFAPGAIQASDLTGVINAATINANEINAINAKLGTATIENGYINNADITIAKIKDLTAENFIAHDAVTDRYYIKKLAVDNAQMVYATVGELVVKATNNKYYRLDIDANGALSPTEVTLTQGEITAGITSDGRATIIETDLTVTDLSASNAKAINALIDKLTASRIDVDELFARAAFIGKLNTTDISSNSSLQLYVQNNAYTRKTGIYITDNGVEIDAGKYVKIKAASGQTAAGKFIVESGNFTVDENGNVSLTGTVNAGAGSVIGGWNLGANRLYSGSGTGYVAIDSDTSGTYALWAGHGTASSAPFRVQRDGSVTVTKLISLGEDGSEEEVNLRQAGLWKLYYQTVKTFTASTSSGGVITLTLDTTGGPLTVNFNAAGSVTLSHSWSGDTYTVTASNGQSDSLSLAYATNTGTSSQATTTVNTFNSSHKAYFVVYDSNGSWARGCNIDASGVYTSGVNSVTVTSVAVYGTPAATATSISVQGTASNGQTKIDSINITTQRNNAHNTGGATAKVNQSSQTLGYGASVTVTAQYVNAAGTTVNTSSACTITAPADRYWTGYNACAGTVGIDGTDKTLGYGATETLHGTYTNQGGQTTTRGTRKITAPAVPGITSCTMGSAVTGTTYNVTVALAGTTKSSTINAAAAYNAGWNACMDACGFSSGGETFCTGGVNYVNLWTAPNEYGVRLSNCLYGRTEHTAPSRK